MSGQFINGIADADKIFDKIFEYCAEAGEACQLNEGGKSSAAQIRRRYERIVKDLDDYPIPKQYNSEIAFTTGDTIRSLTFAVLYGLELLASPITRVVASYD